jgi:hypothetical protein
MLNKSFCAGKVRITVSAKLSSVCNPKLKPGVLKLKILEFAFLISDSFLVRISPDIMFQRK